MGSTVNQTDLLSRKESEHEELQFGSFTNRQALELGLRIAAVAEEHHYPIAIDIERYAQQVFHYACDGTSADNDQWIERKKRVVRRFGKSSSYIKTLLKSNGSTLEEMFYLDSREYAAFCGSFPVLVRNVGPVGTITVSGLPDEEDHNLVVSVVREFIHRDKAGKSA